MLTLSAFWPRSKNATTAIVTERVAPLVPAADALVLDSTTLSIEQVIEKALQYARQKLALA